MPQVFVASREWVAPLLAARTAGLAAAETSLDLGLTRAPVGPKHPAHASPMAPSSPGRPSPRSTPPSRTASPSSAAPSPPSASSPRSRAGSAR